MDKVVTASPGEDSPLLNTEADTVYLPVTVSGGNAEVIAGSETGEGAAVDSPEGNSPYTVVFSADESISVRAGRYHGRAAYSLQGSDRQGPGEHTDDIYRYWYHCRDAYHAGPVEWEEMMDIFTYVSIASQCMIIGAVCECVAILTGYVCFYIFQLIEGGK